MAKQRRRVVPARRVRLRHEGSAWTMVKAIDLPPTPVPASDPEPDDNALWVQAVDRHDAVLHRVVLADTADEVDVILPLDTRCVALNLYQGAPTTEPVATFSMVGGGAGGPARLR